MLALEALAFLVRVELLALDLDDLGSIVGVADLVSILQRKQGEQVRVQAIPCGGYLCEIHVRGDGTAPLSQEHLLRNSVLERLPRGHPTMGHHAHIQLSA